MYVCYEYVFLLLHRKTKFRELYERTIIRIYSRYRSHQDCVCVSYSTFEQHLTTTTHFNLRKKKTNDNDATRLPYMTANLPPIDVAVATDIASEKTARR